MASSSRFDPIYLRPTEAVIDLDALVHNLKVVRRLVGGAKVMAVVKGNAYGHGLAECARALESAGADSFGAAFLEEAISLRLAGIKAPILVLGGVFADQLPYFFEYDIEILASSTFKLEAIEKEAKALGKRARIHLKIDTGMERIGAHSYNAEQLFAAALECKHCDIVGVSTHFASQEDTDFASTGRQLEQFLESLSFFEKRGVPMPVRHAAASGAIMQFPETHLDMVRPGLMLYGIAPAGHLDKKLDLKPVMSLRSKVVYFKVVKKGAGVSYDHRWHAPEDTRVVTVPIGYGDGYPRALTNKTEVLIRGNRYPGVGTICMDQMMVDIGPNGVAYNGEEVMLLGQQGAENIRLIDLCDRISGNPREFLVLVTARVPRIFLRKDF